MKLRNKKTGEIGNLLLNINPNRESYSVLSSENGNTMCGNIVIADYDSLAELNEEWEDYKYYEEPKKHYFITEYGKVSKLNEIDKNLPDTDIRNINCDENIEDYQSIGNYFETEEEAKKAVEKLKAFKRLKDKGFSFDSVDRYEALCGNGFNIPITATMPPEAYTDTEVSKDLDLLFSGEDD